MLDGLYCALHKNVHGLERCCAYLNPRTGSDYLQRALVLLSTLLVEHPAPITLDDKIDDLSVIKMALRDLAVVRRAAELAVERHIEAEESAHQTALKFGSRERGGE